MKLSMSTGKALALVAAYIPMVLAATIGAIWFYLRIGFHTGETWAKESMEAVDEWNKQQREKGPQS